MAVKPIPEGYHTLTPYLVVRGVDKLLTFVQRAFDAKVTHCSKRPDGTVMHAAALVGDSQLMMGEAPGDAHLFPGMLYMYVLDTDATYHRALRAGATSLCEPVDQFYGDRNAGVVDPFGNQWWFATHIEDMSDEELAKRAQAQMKQPSHQ